MQVTFRLTRDELRQARRLFYYRLRSRAERFTDYAFIALTLGILAIAAFRIYLVSYHGADFPWVLIAFFTVMAAQSWRRHHEFADEPDYSKKQTFDVEEDGIFRSTWPGKKAKLPWTKVSKYVEGDDMFLLLSPWPWGAESEPRVSWATAWRLKPVLFILPKRAFAPGELEAFRSILDRKLSVWAKERSEGHAVLHSQA